MLFDSLGTILFVGSLVALGHLFRGAIGDLLSWLGELGEYGVLLVLAAVGLYLVAKWSRRQMFIRQLRMDRITVAQLRKLIADGEKPIIVDVRSNEARAEGIIPGAVVVNLDDIELPAINDPLDREVVIYCGCPNEASAATAAQRLKHASFKRIRPLLGGIDAWVSAGGPIELPRSGDGELLSGLGWRGEDVLSSGS
jgi:rhodanese-related sulfurtransferase